MYELVANSVTAALGKELEKIFPDVPWYRETSPTQLCEYPHWFVHQLTINTASERRNYFMVNYLINMRYHIAADPSKVTGNLQEQLDDAGIKILSELEYIYFDGMPVRVVEQRTEKVDGVLHWFGNISIMTHKPKAPEPVQETLETDITKE